MTPLLADAGEDLVAWLYVFWIVGPPVAAVLFIGIWKLRKEWTAHRTDWARELGALAPILSATMQRPSQGLPFLHFERNGLAWDYVHWNHAASRTFVTTIEIKAGADAFFDAISEESPRYPNRPPRCQRIRKENPQFRIVTTDPVWAERRLDSGLLELLKQLRVTAEAPVRVQMTGDHSTVEVERWLKPLEALEVVRFGDRLVTLNGARKGDTGITLVESTETPGGAVCQVCTSAMDGEVVRCLSCRTPHHKDCWEYLGRCSTFGCRSRTAS